MNKLLNYFFNISRFYTLGTNSATLNAALTFVNKSYNMNVGIYPSLCFIIRVTYVVADMRFFVANNTLLRH